MTRDEKLSNMKKEIIQVLTSEKSFQKLHEADRFFKMLDDILYAMNESTIISITDCDGTILYVNEGFCRLSKYSKDELIGKNYQIFNSGYHSKEFYKKMLETINNGQTWKGEIKNRAKWGNDFWVNTVIVPFVNDLGEPYRYFSLLTDITEKKQIETQFKTNFIKTFHKLQSGIFKIRKEPDGTLTYTMSEGKLMEEIGANSEIILNKSPFEIFGQDVAKLKHEMYKKAFEGNRVQYEIEHLGKLVYIDIEPIQHNGEIKEIVGTVYDFSDFRDVHKQLKVNEELYQSLINYSHDYITAINKDGIIVDMNPNTMELLGVNEEMIGKLDLIEATVEEERPIIATYFEKAIRGEIQFFEFEVKNNGQRKFLNVTLVPIVIDNEIERVYSIGKDITEEKLIQERNAYLAHHDDLTGLHNRRWMEQKIQETLKQAEKNNHKFELLSLDLDRFKSVNDTLGHFVGDELLQQIAERLQNNNFKDKFHVARMGGDEFMILCPYFDAEEEVTMIARNILESLENPLYIQGSELLITASIGIVFYPSSGTDVTKLMKRVDIALYKAKELGRNMYQIFDKSMNRKHYKSFIMERDLRKAILNDEFIAYLQPRVDTLTGNTVGAEALIRWNHPKRGLISPSRFISIAEETGLIISIGNWMLKRVCDQLVEWRKAGYSLIPISVNISSKRFLQKGFAEDIQKLLEEYELEGEWLEIEITENSIMQNEAIVQKTLKDLKEMGVKIFIDDFGTGYSSFSYLKTFDLNGVKIDQSFIRNIHTIPENASITSAMIKVAQHLKLEVIAEGVETKEELKYLLGDNCRYIQGFYFGKPCPIDEFERKYLKCD